MKKIVTMLLTLMSFSVFADDFKNFDWDNHGLWQIKDQYGNCIIPDPVIPVDDDLPPLPPIDEPPVDDNPPPVDEEEHPVDEEESPVEEEPRVDIPPPPNPVLPKPYKFNQAFSTPVFNCSSAPRRTALLPLDSSFYPIKLPAIRVFYSKNKVFMRDSSGVFTRVPTAITVLKPFSFKPAWTGAKTFVIPKGTYYLNPAKKWTFSGINRKNNNGNKVTWATAKVNSKIQLVSQTNWGKDNSAAHTVFGVILDKAYDRPSIPNKNKVKRGYWVICK